MLIDIHTHHPAEHIAIRNWRYGTEEMPQTDYYSIGIHPWDAEADSIDNAFIAAAENALAIGECGLDKRRRTSPASQERLFRSQIELSERLCKPLIVHCVQCYGKTLSIYKELKPAQPWIMHGCYASAEWIAEAVKAGMYISIGAAQLTLKRGAGVAAATPVEHILLETDEAHNTLDATYATIAQIKGIAQQELEAAIERNFRSIFPRIEL